MTRDKVLFAAILLAAVALVAVAAQRRYPALMLSLLRECMQNT